MSEQVIEYEAPRHRWRIGPRFLIALVFNCLALFIGVALLKFMHDALNFSGGENYSVLTLIVVGLPALFVQIACLVVPIAIGFGERETPWRRSQWAVLAAMGVVSVVLPAVGLFIYART